MGIIKGGILGGFRKKTGNVVGAYWRTLDVIRGLPRSNGKARTQVQKDQLLKFGLTSSFLSWLADLVDVGYRAQSSVATPMNIAVSHNLKIAIAGVSPNFTLDYTKVSFSDGKLEVPLDLEVESVTGAKVKYSWTHSSSDDRFVDATDMATVLVYNLVKDRFVKVVNAVPRSAGTFTLQMPAMFAGDDVYCYISFTSMKTKFLVSKSRYLGMIAVL